ncbi:MAG: hypothetical protein PHC74_01555 [Sulfurimonas sp.]|nr:hypothetical protein [Sulfurimonas sp.]
MRQFDIKKSVQSDFNFCEKTDSDCTKKIEQYKSDILSFENNPDNSFFKKPDINLKKTEIERLKRLKISIVGKKYVFNNRIVFITYSKALINSNDTRSYQNTNVYISKDDIAAGDFLNLGIGDIDSHNGTVLEIAEHYDIEQDDKGQLFDIKNIHYETINGKEICQSYRELIYGETNKQTKINIKQIFSYKNIIQSPEQNKFYEIIKYGKESNFIIVNGQAGTGKTTVAIDALKDTPAIFIVLNQAKKAEIEREKIQNIYLFEEIHTILEQETKFSISSNYELLLNEIEMLSLAVINKNEEMINLLKQVEIVKISDDLKKYFELIKTIILNNKIDEININELIKKLETEVNKQKEKINNLYFSLKIPYKLISIPKKMKYKTKKPEIKEHVAKLFNLKEVLNKTKEEKMLNEQNINFTHKKSSFNFINRLIKGKKNKFNNKAYGDIEKIIYSEEFINKYFFEYKSAHVVFFTKSILSVQPKFSFFKKIPKTVLIDEYQQIKQIEVIDLFKIAFQRVILIGDNAQTQKTVIYEPQNADIEKIIFTRNFRQTYQLATASLIVRKLITNDELSIPKEKDYYKDQIEFNKKRYQKPHIYYSNKSILGKLIDIRNQQIDLYEHKFPIMIVYEKESILTVLQLNEQLKKEYEVGFFKKNIEIENYDFIFFTIDEIQGEEAPIIVYISEDNTLNLAHFYISITRAQFEFYGFTKSPLLLQDEYKDYFQIFDFNKIDSFEIRQDIHKLSEEEATKKIEYISKNINNSKINNQQKKEDKASNNKQIKNKHKNNEALSTEKNIEKHKSQTTQWQEDIEPDIIIDEEHYKNDFIKKVSEDIKNFEETSKEEIIKKIIVIDKNKARNDELKNDIKGFLQNTYKGYCQICGFTFRKVADNQNSFEFFSWNDKRIVKNKKSFVSTADSLCLCRNCSANLKWGAFEPIFLERIENIENFESAKISNIIEVIHKAVDKNLPDIFKEHLDFNDIYTLEIKLNGEPKNIYFTTAHVVQFIAYLQLERLEC